MKQPEAKWLKNQRFFKYNRWAFPKILWDNEAKFYGSGISSQVFGFDEDKFVYIRSINPILESTALYVDFDEHPHITHIRRIRKWETELPIIWFRAEKLYWLDDDNVKLVKAMQRAINKVNLSDYNRILNIFEEKFPEYYEDLETLINRAQDWTHEIKLDFYLANVMQRSDRTIVFNDVVHLWNFRKVPIKLEKYFPVNEVDGVYAE